MVAQCPTCQSKFRIADEKVTERGVRVRCSSCKTVFQVRKPGSDDEPPAQDLAGTTLDLQGFETGRIPTGKVKPAPAAPAAQGRKPTTAPLAGPGAAKASGPGARRLDADDLFGMDELTGEADPKPGSPLANPPPPAAPAPSHRRTGPVSRPAPARAAPAAPPAPEAGESISFEDIDLEVATPKAAAPEARVRTGRTAPVPLRSEDPPDAAGAPTGSRPGTGPVKDSFGDLELDRPAAEPPLELSAASAPLETAASSGPASRAEARTDTREPSSPPSAPPARIRPAASRARPAAPEGQPFATGGGLAGSALTGVVAAAVTLAVLVAAGASGGLGGPLRWLSAGGDDVVAAHVSSGLYDTASGHPVFFVRGTLENHGKSPRGPFRVIAELIGEGGNADARAEASVGAVPAAEDVYALSGEGAADKLARSLAQAAARTPLAAGGSAPFFALIAEPPADPQRHTLRVRLEAADTAAPAPRTALKPSR